jgi:hypothetical protein
MTRPIALLFFALCVAAFSPAQANAAQVAVTVETLTEDGEFIVEPELLDLPDGATTAQALSALLAKKGIDFRCDGSLTAIDFFVTRIGKFGAHWMVTVNNSFVRPSAGTYKLGNGVVMRWQYSEKDGLDIGAGKIWEWDDNIYVPVPSKYPSKDDLIKKMAQINAAGNKSDYGKAYTDALTVLKKLNPAVAEINSALNALNGGGTTPGDTTPGGTTPGGTTPDDTTPGGITPRDITPDGTTPGDTTPGGSSATVEAEIIDKPVVALIPDGIEAGINPRGVTGSEMEGLGFGDIITVKTNGAVTVSEGVFKAALAESGIVVDAEKPIAPLPVFRVGVSEGGTALVTLKASMDGYAGETLGSVAVFKMTYKGSAVRLVSASSPTGLKHGAFVWTDGAGNAMQATEAVTAGNEYFISVAIKDDSDFDLDGWKAGSIVDPLALAAANPGSTTSDNHVPPPDEPGGGGGCDSGLGAFGLLAAFGLISARRRGR